MSLTNKISTLSTIDAAIRAAVGGVFVVNPHYDWVGVYLLEENVLTLQEAHYLGLETEHARIPIAEGICGAAARTGETIVIDDVRADPRYLACSISVRSEIVVPILAGDTVVGVLDIDSDTPTAFSSSDRQQLEEVAAALAEVWVRATEPA